MHVLIAGVSTRAAAESAVRAGFAVTTIDAFNDLDVAAGVHVLPLPQGFTAVTAAKAAAGVAVDAVVYLSSFENHPRSVAALAAGRALWGNGTGALERVRDPARLAQTLRESGCATPEVVTSQEAFDALAAAPEGQWMVKPLASGGGRRVCHWRPGTPVPRGGYLQAYVDGTSGSVVFVSASGVAVPLGLSRQLVGEEAFGATGYQYCGNILAAADDPQFADDEVLVGAAGRLAQAVTAGFGLVGVNGVDFVARHGVPWAVEVNPRWSAAIELVERAYGFSAFAAHAEACRRGTLPAFDLASARRVQGAIGKAIVFARRDVVIGDTAVWLPSQGVDVAEPVCGVRDVPRPGQRISGGRPICTVFAAGIDAAACHAALVRRAQRVYAALEPWERETPRPRRGDQRF